MIERLHGRFSYVYLPGCVDHSPPDGHRSICGYPDMYFDSMTVCDILEYFTQTFPRYARSTDDDDHTKYEHFGRHLAMHASVSTEEFFRSLRIAMRMVLVNRMLYLEQRHAGTEATAVRADLMAIRRRVLDVVCGDDFVVPIEIRRRYGDSGGMEGFMHEIRRFGGLLTLWPTLVRGCLNEKRWRLSLPLDAIRD